MFHGSLSKKVVAAGAAAAVALGAAACGSSSNATTTASGKKLTTVTMMVGGIDKQIYLPYQLGYDLGFFKKYGINMVLSTESNGGVGAETAMASGQVDLAGAWYNHTLEFQQAGKSVIDLAQLSGAPGEREMCAMNSGVKTPADWKGKSVGVTDPGSGTDDLTIYLAARYHLPTNQFNRAGVGAGETLLASLQHKTTVCSMTSQPTSTPSSRRRSPTRRSTWPPLRGSTTGSGAPTRPPVCSASRAGSTATRSPPRRWSTPWWRPCTGSRATARPTWPTTCHRSSSRVV